MLVSVIVIIIFWYLYVLHEEASWVAIPCACGAAVSYLFWLLLSGNRPSRARIKNAQKMVRKGTIHTIQMDADRFAALSVGGLVRFFCHGIFPILGAAILSTLSLFVPTIARLYNSNVVPGYVAPGDRFEYTFQHTIITVGGRWHGHPELTLVNTEEVGRPVPLTGTGSYDTWDGNLKKNYKYKHPVIMIRIPDDPVLTGKKIVINIRMEVTYPKPIGYEEGKPSYENQTETFESSIPVVLTDSETSKRLHIIWWVSLVLAAIFILFPPFLLFLIGFRFHRPLPPNDILIAAPPTPLKTY